MLKASFKLAYSSRTMRKKIIPAGVIQNLNLLPGSAWKRVKLLNHLTAGRHTATLPTRTCYHKGFTLFDESVFLCFSSHHASSHCSP